MRCAMRYVVKGLTWADGRLMGWQVIRWRVRWPLPLQPSRWKREWCKSSVQPLWKPHCLCPLFATLSTHLHRKSFPPPLFTTAVTEYLTTVSSLLFPKRKKVFLWKLPRQENENMTTLQTSQGSYLSLPQSKDASLVRSVLWLHWSIPRNTCTLHYTLVFCSCVYHWQSNKT